MDPSSSENVGARSAKIERQKQTTRAQCNSSPICAQVIDSAHLRHEQVANFFRWRQQAVSMLNRFWVTGNLKHLCAFVVHIVAMRRRLVARDEAKRLAR